MENFNDLGMRNEKANSIKDFYFKKAGKKMDYGFIESFSGPGGMSLGLEKAGFNLLYAFDKDKKAVETHCFNIKRNCIEADASKLSGELILRKVGLKKGELPLFTGGPPCQGFSKQKRGAHIGDHRNQLVYDYIRLALEIEPRFFLFENVAIFGQKRGKEFLASMFKDFKNYVLYPHFYNSADYGLAQTRERFIAVGKRIDQKATFQIPKPNCSKWKTIKDVLLGFPEPPHDFTDHPKFPNHQRARVTEANIKRFSYVPEGGGWQDIPNDIRLDCHKDAQPTKGGWPDVYGRLKWDGQCPTITGGFDSFTRGRYGHPKYDRPITPREAAKLQGFPDSFEFKGNRGDVRSQIGNAVPPPLAEAIGLEIFRSLLCADGKITDTGVDSKIGHQETFGF